MNIKIELNFNYWKNINIMIFDILIYIDDISKPLDGVMFYDLKIKKHSIDHELEYMLNNKGINDKIILNALDQKYYKFKILPRNKNGISPILFPFK